MGPNGNPTQQQNPGNPSQQQQDQMMSAGPSAQQVPMGQPQMPTGTFQQPMLSSPIGAPGAGAQYAQYVLVNQSGQQILQPAMNVIPGMAMPTQNPQQQGQPQILYMQPQQAQPGAKQPQMIAGAGPAASQSVSKSMSQAPTYTLSQGIMSQTGAPQFMVVGGPAAMGGSPTLQATAPNMSMSTSTSMPSHIKAEPGKQMATAQQQQAQPVGQQPMQILGPPGAAYVNAVQPAQGQAYINQNGQVFFRAPGPQDGQATTQLISFSPQGPSMQAHPQPMQPGLPTQQLPQGLSTSMQPMTSLATTGGTNVVRAPVGGYPTPQAPVGKTQISRAQPTLLPATSTSTNATNRMSTAAPSFVTQPSPRSKQKQMSPRTTGAHTFSNKGGGINTQAATKSILNNIKQQNQMGSSGSPPLLTSSASPLSLIPPPGSPSATGPPVLQTSLTAPPPQSSNSNSQPPLLHPMTGSGPMIPPMPTSTSTLSSTTTSSYVNGGRPVTMATTLSVTSAGGFKSIDTSGKVPIRPSQIPNKPIPAAPMEPISKTSNNTLPISQNSLKPPQDFIQHVIDGHVIHESSQPFPLEEDIKGKFKSFTLTSISIRIIRMFLKVNSVYLE